MLGVTSPAQAQVIDARAKHRVPGLQNSEIRAGWFIGIFFYEELSYQLMKSAIYPELRLQLKAGQHLPLLATIANQPR